MQKKGSTMKKLLASMFLVLLATVSLAGELEVGSKGVKFALQNSLDGKTVSYTPGDGKVSVVVFTCNSCPYSKAFENRLAAIGRDYAKKGVVFYAINPNDDVAYPKETLAEMKARATDKGFSFPYLKDADSSIAKAYGARVTPHVFLLDGSGVVRYRGYVDDSAKTAEREHTGLTDALDALLTRKDIKVAATNAFGCTI